MGILVLFLHDINDIQLEFSKLNIYLKSRGGGYYLLNDVLSNMGSVSFSITWSVSAARSLIVPSSFSHRSLIRLGSFRRSS